MPARAHSQRHHPSEPELSPALPMHPMLHLTLIFKLSSSTCTLEKKNGSWQIHLLCVCTGWRDKDWLSISSLFLHLLLNTKIPAKILPASYLRPIFPFFWSKQMQAEAFGVAPGVPLNDSSLLARLLKEEQLSCRVQASNCVLPMEAQDLQPSTGQCQGPG